MIEISHPDLSGHHVTIDALSADGMVLVRCECGANMDFDGKPSGAALREVFNRILAHYNELGETVPRPEGISLIDEYADLFDTLHP